MQVHYRVVFKIDHDLNLSGFNCDAMYPAKCMRRCRYDDSSGLLPTATGSLDRWLVMYSQSNIYLKLKGG